MIAQEMVPDEMSAPTAESPGQFNKIELICNFDFLLLLLERSGCFNITLAFVQFVRK
jgi:hypothetical protein